MKIFYLKTFVSFWEKSAMGFSQWLAKPKNRGAVYKASNAFGLHPRLIPLHRLYTCPWNSSWAYHKKLIFGDLNSLELYKIWSGRTYQFINSFS